MYVQANKEMVHLFKAAQFEMIDQAGTPLTPYTLRPGSDEFRVWSTATDAGRSTETFDGGGGGWFRLTPPTLRKVRGPNYPAVASEGNPGIERRRFDPWLYSYAPAVRPGH